MQEKRGVREPIVGDQKSVVTSCALSKEIYNFLVEEAKGAGVTMASIISEALTLRQKIKSLNAKGVILATKDSKGEIVEIGPIGLLR